MVIAGGDATSATQALAPVAADAPDGRGNDCVTIAP